MVQSKASHIRAFPNVSTTRSHLTPQEQVHSSIVRMGSTGLPSSALLFNLYGLHQFLPPSNLPLRFVSAKFLSIQLFPKKR
jgi:hypothetical protein